MIIYDINKNSAACLYGWLFLLSLQFRGFFMKRETHTDIFSNFKQVLFLMLRTIFFKKAVINGGWFFVFLELYQQLCGWRTMNAESVYFEGLTVYHLLLLIENNDFAAITSPAEQRKTIKQRIKKVVGVLLSPVEEISLDKSYSKCLWRTHRK